MGYSQNNKLSFQFEFKVDAQRHSTGELKIFTYNLKKILIDQISVYFLVRLVTSRPIIAPVVEIIPQNLSEITGDSIDCILV